MIAKPICFIAHTALLLAILNPVQDAGADAARPNIVLLLADDLGWNDVGFHGSEIRTPHIDGLAERGVVLDQFYVQPTCTPTRIALMTGRYPFRCGGHVCVLRPHHKHGVPLDERFLSEALQQAGYKTSITGKWHLGLARRRYWPGSRGFDLCYGHLGGGIDYFTHKGHGSLDWYDNDNMPLREEGYSTDLIGTRAVKVIDEHRFGEKPLFLYVPFNAPHAPRQAKEDDLAEYAGIKNPRRRTHAAMVTAMDHQIGEVLAALDRAGAADNTLVLFASDNGGYQGAADNSPLRGHKGTLYEGGVRVPACVVWPGGLQGNRTVSSCIHIVDLFPTLTKLACGSIESDKPLDGINVWPAIASGSPIPERDIIHNAFNATGRGALRRGNWKLIAQPKRVIKDGIPLGQAGLRAQLFNIKDDPNESDDLSAVHPELASQLWDTLKQHGKQAGDSSPYCQKAPAGWTAPPDWSQVQD